MKKKSLLLIPGLALVFILVFALVFSACPGGLTDAETPRITAQPTNKNYDLGDTAGAAADPLRVTVAALTDGGELSYQWYKIASGSQITANDEAITNATNNAYSPPVDVLSTYYCYVKVTNTNNAVDGLNQVSVNSNAVRVRVQDPSAEYEPNLIVDLDNTRRQYIRGVGGMSDQCFIYGNGDWTDRVTLDDIQNMFGHGPQELGLNMYRLVMYPWLEEAPYEYTGPKGALTWRDPTQGIVDDTTLYRPGSGNKSGTLPQDQSDYYEIIKKINENGGYVMIVPWALPRELTSAQASGGGGYGSGTGNRSYVNPNTYNELADWYVSYIQNLIDNGAPIFALSLQNEPDFSSPYDGCIWEGNTQRDLIRILGPKLEAAGIKGYGGGKEWDKVWIATGDTAGLPGTIGSSVVNDTGPGGAAHYTELACRHLYGSSGNVGDVYFTARDNPDHNFKEIWQTEHCDTTNASDRSPEAVRNIMSGWNWVWHMANEVYNTFQNNRENAFIWWTSKRFYGFIGEGNFTTTNGAILPRGHVMAHFGKYAANTWMLNLTVSGSFEENLGTNAGSGTGGLTGTDTEVVVGTNLNPTSFGHGNSDTAGQNQPTTKIMAFEADDGSYISVVAFTPTRNSGAGGQDAGIVQINLPEGFIAASAELMRSNASVKQEIESVVLNSTRTAGIIELPRNEIVSVKFMKQQ